MVGEPKGFRKNIILARQVVNLTKAAKMTFKQKGGKNYKKGGKTGQSCPARGLRGAPRGWRMSAPKGKRINMEGGESVFDVETRHKCLQRRAMD